MTRSETWAVTAIAAVILTLVAPRALHAQEQRRDGDWWRWALAEVLVGEEVRTSEGRTVRIDPDRILRERNRRFEREEGPGIPAFCRTGEGHPVFGREWCIQKGFGLGRVSWRRGDLGDIIFRGSPRRDGAILDRRVLGEVLGDVILDRLFDASDERGRNVPVTGRWLEEAGVRVLQLRAGDRPLAELSDLDGDGVVDVLLRADGE